MARKRGMPSRLLRHLLGIGPERPPIPARAAARGIVGPWAARYFSITTSDDPTRAVRDWDDVERALAYLDEGGPAFVILGWEDEEYIQAGGTLDQLTVEVRRARLFGHVHCTLGVASRGDPGREVRVPCVAGYITVREDEVLTREEARGIFLHYFENAATPAEFKLRRRVRV